MLYCMIAHAAQDVRSAIPIQFQRSKSDKSLSLPTCVNLQNLDHFKRWHRPYHKQFNNNLIPSRNFVGPQITRRKDGPACPITKDT